MTAKRPALALVREGNPGHRPQGRLDGGLHLAPEAPAEPDWREWFPTSTGSAQRNGLNRRARNVARAEWRRIVPILDAQGLLSSVDMQTLADYCCLVSQMDECKRNLATEGLWVWGERGAMKNPCSTVLNQLRQQFRWSVQQLGLSPVARDGLSGGGDGDDAGDAFD